MVADIRLDKVALKESMTIDMVYEYLTKLGVNGYWVDSDKLVFETVCHNCIGEGSNKLYYYENTKLFNCFTSCGRFDIFELLSKMNQQENGEELELNDAVEKYIKSQSFLILDGSNTSEKKEKDSGEYVKPRLQKFNGGILSEHKDALVKDWLDEGISRKTQRKYGIKYSPAMGGAIFPHYDEFGGLVGVRARLLAEEEIRRYGKYRPLEKRGILYSNPSSFYLFGLMQNNLQIRLRKKAIVFEGEKSTMKMDDVMGENNNISVASFGMHFSRHQFELLSSIGVEEIIFALDKQFEEIGDKEFNNLLRVMKTINERFLGEGVKLSFILDTDNITDYKDSPIDKGFDSFNTLYRNKKTYEEIEKEFVNED